MNLGRLLLAGVLVLVIGVTQWVLQRERDDEGDERLGTARADYSLDEFELVVMNAAGLPRFVLRSPALQRRPTDGSAVVTTPRVELYDDGNHAWTLTAREGWVGNEGAEVRFFGDVDVVSETLEPTRIFTQSMTIFPDSDRAEGDEHIVITEPNSRLEGVGYRARLDTRSWELLSQVRARLIPSRS